MSDRDTIAAIATAHGNAGIGVIRISGPDAHAVAHAVTGRTLTPRFAHHTVFRSKAGDAIDSGLVLWFPAPRSYTGEDVVEFQGHGNPVVQDRLLRVLYALGVRPARPGEFSERAFLEGRLDLAQAEAVADLIGAGSVAAARAAQRSLDGEFSRRIDALLEALVKARMHVEAAIDFPEEEIDFLSDGAVLRRLDALDHEHGNLLAAAERGQRLRDGRVVAIVGRPNAGKSSLLNALAGTDRAIVTDVAGTTRDILREDIRLGPLVLTLIDTAGLRESADAIEAEGVRRARAELARADHALLVIDASAGDDVDELRRECPPSLPRTLVFNKIDLIDRPPSIDIDIDVDVGKGVEPMPQDARALPAYAAPATAPSSMETRIFLSARSGEGLDLLVARLTELAGAGAGFDGAFSARARHVDALRRAGEYLRLARHRLLVDRAGELVAEDLRQAQQALSEITGAFTPDDLLGSIFGSFCIGK
jgi:tRNA modification GTPase